MKPKIKLFILLLTLYSSANAQDLKSKPYEFSVKPGSKEWAAFKSGQEMLDACQIPESVLKSMSTKTLAETCLSYPLFLDYLASNNEREGIRIMIENFNGLKELSNRKDGAIELISLYKSIPIVNVVQDKSSLNYHAPYKAPFIELLLSSEGFMKQLNDSD